jgi:hypothetical protein
MKNLTLVALVLVLTTVACSSGGSTTSPVTTAPSTTTITVSGIVPAAVNGVGQSAFNNFNVGQSGGAVTLTLTSAVETYPSGMLIAGVVMGLAVGSPTGGTCTVSAGVTPQPVQPGATGLSGSLNAGAYCVQVSDLTIQQGPVAYTLVIVVP